MSYLGLVIGGSVFSRQRSQFNTGCNSTLGVMLRPEDAYQLLEEALALVWDELGKT